MKHFSRFSILFFLFSLLLLGLSGCDQIASVLIGKTPPDPGEVLFQDDFSNNKNNWGTMGRTGGQIGMEYGGMVISVDVSNFLFWTVNGDNYTDAQIDVDAVLLDGPLNDNFGVLCRYVDNQHFYGLMITHDGYFGIFKMIDGEMMLLNGEGEMQYSESIRQGGVVNHIEAICSGDRLSLSVNDTLLSEIQDGDYTSGKAGLAAGAYQDPGVKVFFDNFVIRQP
jgi:hypothetical protein